MSFESLQPSHDWAIQADDLGKVYRIYDKPHHRLFEALWRGRRQFGREFVALQGVSFHLARGETLGIIGANGAGKSTLLQMLVGTVQPTRGNLQVNGRIAALLELGAGFNPEFSGRENAVINAAILGLSERQIAERLDDIIAFADIGTYIDQPVKTYSSGMYVRLAFAVAAHVSPDILVVDEALAVGDARFQAKCMRRMRSMLDGGATLLLTSHDIGAIKSLCQRCLWLDKGRMRQIGPASGVTRAYDLDWVRAANEQGGFAPQAESATAESSGAVDTGHVRLLALQISSDGVWGQTIRVAYGQPLRLQMRLGIRHPCANLVVSYHLKNRHNLPVLGGHSGTRSDIYARDWKAGDSVDIDFEIPIHLQHGDYTLTVLAASISDTVRFSDAVFHLWAEAAGTLQVLVRPEFPLSDCVEPPQVLTATDASPWVILDDFFPNLLTGFRVAEYNAHLQHFSGLRIMSLLPDFSRQHATYLDAHGERLARSIQPYDATWLAGCRLAYINFLNNAAHFLADMQQHRLPFVLTLYPGGGFALNDPDSDAKLDRVLGSGLLRAIVVTQPVTLDYLRHFAERFGHVLPRVEYIGGVVVSPRYFSPEFPGHLAYHGENKPTLDVCFVAERYMSLAVDKGYPCFLEAMHALGDLPNLRIHVVGGGYADEERALAVGLGERVHFYGRLHTLELMQFYREMDIIVAPNSPGRLRPGGFDGFPTGCCVEAALSGVALVAADPLGANPGYTHGQDILLLPSESDAEAAGEPEWPAQIANHIRELAADPERLQALARAGQAVTRRLYAPEVQIAPRQALLRQVAQDLGFTLAERSK